MCSSELRVTEQPTELKSPGFDDGKTFTQDLFKVDSIMYYTCFSSYVMYKLYII